MADIDRNLDEGCKLFNHTMQGMTKYGWLVPGQEPLSRMLILAAITTDDDVAMTQLRDLYMDAGMDEMPGKVDRFLPNMREVYKRWTEPTRKTFLRHCREKGVYRQRDCRGRKAPRTSAEPKLAQSAV